MLKEAWEKREQIMTTEERKRLENIKLGIELFETSLNNYNGEKCIVAVKGPMEFEVIDHFLIKGYDVEYSESHWTEWSEDWPSKYHEYTYIFDCSKAEKGKKGIFIRVK